MKHNPLESMSPALWPIYKAILKDKYTHYWLKGGRGSTKSSFISLVLVLGIMKSPDSNGVIIRKVADTLRNSVYSQVLWAIDKLQVDHLFTATVSPMEIAYKPTGQKLIFRGADDPTKLKSIKFIHGYAKFVWFEELTEFNGIEEIDNINQSLLRGGDQFAVFYSYNPPKSCQSWVNLEAKINKPGRLVHHSSYENVPQEWLGPVFLAEAEHIKKINPKRWENVYGGAETGTGGEVFENVINRPITDTEIAVFDKIKIGCDFGYSSDPTAIVWCNFDKTRRRLYIFDEVYQLKLSARGIAEEIKSRGYRQTIIADSAEPRSIAELISLNVPVVAAKKGPDSVDHGLKSLADLEQIIIDADRCPNAYREFTQYELERDKYGGFKASYPDKNNHCLDACRYSLESDFKEDPWAGFFGFIKQQQQDSQITNPKYLELVKKGVVK
jgi:phage terminase large subunit